MWGLIGMILGAGVALFALVGFVVEFDNYAENGVWDLFGLFFATSLLVIGTALILFGRAFRNRQKPPPPPSPWNQPVEEPPQQPAAHAPTPSVERQENNY